MSANLLKHEEKSMVLSQKITLMKNQMMEYNRHIGIDRKFGAVRCQTLKNYPVTVSPPFSLTLVWYSSPLKRTKARANETRT